jgi:hypothetical protein
MVQPLIEPLMEDRASIQSQTLSRAKLTKTIISEIAKLIDEQTKRSRPTTYLDK